MTQDIPLDKIRIDGGTQPRAMLNQGIVDLYAEEPEKLPPGRAVFDGAAYWLWDGFHRYHALRKSGAPSMALEVTNGTQGDARWLAAGANAEHTPAGLRRTNEDKRNAVRMALAVRPQASDNAIAQHVGVSDKTVASVRASLTSEFPKSETRQYTTRHGTPATMNTSNIGRPSIAGIATTTTPAVLCETCNRRGIRPNCPDCDQINRRTSATPAVTPAPRTLPAPVTASPPPGGDMGEPEPLSDAEMEAGILASLKGYQDRRKLPKSSYDAAVKAVKFWLSGKEVKGFQKPTLEEVAAYCAERGNKVDPQQWMDHYTANGWRVGKNPMSDWKAAVRNWEKSSFTNGKAKPFQGIKDWLDEVEGKK